jgi:hypothetical protein
MSIGQKGHTIGYRAGDGYALALAARKLGRFFRGVRIQLKPAEQLNGNFLGGGWRVAMHLFKRQRDILKRSQMRKQVVSLEHNPHAKAVAMERSFLKLHPLAIKCDLAGIWNFQPREDAKQCCLAASRRTDYHEPVRSVQFERQLIEHLMMAKAF